MDITNLSHFEFFLKERFKYKIGLFCSISDITGFFFRMSIGTHLKAEVCRPSSASPEYSSVMQKKKPVISNTDNFLSFNSNVSNLYNNDAIYKIENKS